MASTRVTRTVDRPFETRLSSDRNVPSPRILPRAGVVSATRAAPAAPMASSEDCLTLNVWTSGEIG